MSRARPSVGYPVDCMARSKPTAEPSRRRRLDPEERRREILKAASPLFAERPLNEITTADVAEAAGCSRGLVHTYFGGIREVFLAVIAEGAIALAQARPADVEVPLRRRVKENTASMLDVLGAHREIWLAISVHSSGDPVVDGLIRAANDASVARTLHNNRDILADTPASRAGARIMNTVSREISRLWLTGEITRAQAEAFITTATRDILQRSIPAMEKAAGD